VLAVARSIAVPLGGRCLAPPGRDGDGSPQGIPRIRLGRPHCLNDDADSVVGSGAGARTSTDKVP
jgi:hypothetical protein